MRSLYLLIAAILVPCLLSCNGKTEEAKKEADSAKVETKKPKTVSMAFVGDMMLGTLYPEGRDQITKDRGQSLFNECKEYLQGADVAIGNLEGVCFDGHHGKIVKDLRKNTTFIFQMPADHAGVIAKAGIDIVNMANNHSIDFGPEGRLLTMKTVKEYGLEVTGLKGLCEGAVVERNGTKIGYVSFAATCINTCDMNDYTEVKRIIGDWRPKCDLLVIGFHGGAEGTAASHVTRKPETYVGEKRGNVYEFAHLCIDLGADIVVGHGPHVPRAMELYKGHLIAYSLGNFCTPFGIGVAGATGWAPLLLTNINVNDGTLADGRVISYLQHKASGPTIDQNHNAARQMLKLMQQDFPDTNISMDDSGQFRVK